MILLWVILNQRKTENDLIKHRYEPACSLKDRLKAYFMVVILPIIMFLLID